MGNIRIETPIPYKADDIISRKNLLDIYIINPAKISALLPSCLQYGDYMQFDLQLLSKCTEMITIIDVMNWNYENSKGCALEFAFANTHNIPISKCYIGL